MLKKKDRENEINNAIVIDKIIPISEKVRKSCSATISELSFAKKPFLILIVIYTVAFSSIFRANFNYIDDMGRAYSGYKGWENFSRYLSNFLSSFVHGNKSFLSEASPLPQLIAILFLSLASVITIYAITERKNISWWEIIAVLPLGLSPYFLGCLSYKFDAPYMALSILVSIFPLIFHKRGLFIYSITIFTCTIAMCATYQAASGIFPMLVALLSFKKWNRGEDWKKVGKFLGISAASYGFGVVVFQKFLMKSANTYVSNNLPIPSMVFSTIYSNLKKYFSFIKSDLPHLWLILILLLMIYFLYASLRSSVRNRWVSFLVSVGFLIILCLLPFGLYPLLAKPLFSPRAMYGFGVLIAFLAVFDVTTPKVYLSKFVSLILSWLFMVFSFTYGNALAVQKEYTDFRIEMVIDTMNHLPTFSTDSTKTVQLSGSIGHAPAIQNAIQQYPILGRLTPVMFRGDGWTWGRWRFANYYGLKNVSSSLKLGIDYELPILTDTMYFTIRGDNQYILIILK